MFDKNVAMRHAELEYPKESCGVVVEGSYRPIQNLAERPNDEFAINKLEFAKLLLLHKVDAFIHSHPDGPAYPSVRDMVSQVETKIPWGIVPVVRGKATELFLWGDGAPIPELIGRPFRHGVTDCYSLIRDWYLLEKNILLPQYPRAWEWWNQGDMLYEDNFKNAGFERLPSGASSQIGDVCLFRIRSRTPNHAGVFVGKGLVLHHLSGRHGYDPTRLSCREPLARRANMVEYWLRHASNTPPRPIG